MKFHNQPDSGHHGDYNVAVVEFNVRYNDGKRFFCTDWFLVFR